MQEWRPTRSSSKRPHRRNGAGDASDDAKLQHLIAGLRGRMANPLNDGNAKGCRLHGLMPIRPNYPPCPTCPTFCQSAEHFTPHCQRIRRPQNDSGRKHMTSSPSSRSLPTRAKEKDKIHARRAPAELDIPHRHGLHIGGAERFRIADYLINFDIHWNPVRIVQRFGADRPDWLRQITQIQLVQAYWARHQASRNTSTLRSVSRTGMHIVDMAGHRLRTTSLTVPKARTLPTAVTSFQASCKRR